MKVEGSRVAVVSLATGRYISFVPQLAESVAKFVRNATLYVLSDGPPPEVRNLTVVWLPWGHLPWPYSTLLRHQAIASYRKSLHEFDLIIHMDIDMRFVQEADFPDDGIFAVSHPGYIRASPTSFPYERRPESAAFIPDGEGLAYFAGGLQGGCSLDYLSVCEVIADWTQRDISFGIIPRWHDESMWNKYCFLNPPDVILPTTYCTPDTGQSSETVVLALTKNHAKYRDLPLAQRISEYGRSIVRPIVPTRFRKLGPRLKQ